MLRSWHAAGFHVALVKLGLDQATQPDASAGSASPDHVTDVPGDNPDAPILPQEIAKNAALGLKDMLFFEKMLGTGGAKDFFQGIERRMSGQGGGTHGTWTPQGVIPRPPPTPGFTPKTPATPPSLDGIVSSAPPPRMR